MTDEAKFGDNFAFLGGTCAGPDYRQDLIPLLKGDWYNPVVANWTPADAEKEDEAKALAGVNVFVITPAAIGAYSIAEVTELAITSPKPLVVAFVEVEGFTWNEHQLKSNAQITKLLARYDAKVLGSLAEVADTVNNMNYAPTPELPA